MEKVIKLIKTNTDIIFILILGSIIRLRLILRDDLWYDEAFTGYMMQISRKAFLERLKIDAHPPLYMWLTKLWTYALGVNDLTLRLLPLIFGVLTILLTYLLAKRLFGKDTAPLAALLIAVSPFLVGYSIEARSYSLFGFLAVLAIYLLITKKTSLFLAVFLLFINTHYMSLAFVPIILLYYLYLISTKTLNWKKELPKLIICGLVVLAAYSWLTNRTSEDLNLEWARNTNLANIPRSIAAYLYGVKVRLGGRDELNNINFPLNELALSGLFFGIYAITSCVLLYKHKKDPRNVIQMTLPVLLFLVPQIILIAYSKKAGINLYVERYLFPASIFFLISLAATLTKTFSFEVSAMLIVFYVFTLTKIQTPNYYTGMKNLSTAFAKSENEVVFTSPTDFLIGKYYFNLKNTDNNIKLYDPQRPDLNYEWWPFVSEEDKPTELESAIIISPEETRITKEFNKLSEDTTFGSYKIFIKN